MAAEMNPHQDKYAFFGRSHWRCDKQNHADVVREWFDNYERHEGWVCSSSTREISHSWQPYPTLTHPARPDRPRHSLRTNNLPAVCHIAKSCTER